MLEKVHGKKLLENHYSDVVTGACNYPVNSLTDVVAAVDFDKAEWSFNDTSKLFYALDDQSCTISYAGSTGKAVVSVTGCTD